MNKEKNKLSLAGRLVRWSLIGGTSYNNSKILSVAFLLLSICWFILGIKTGNDERILFSIIWVMMALVWFQRAGFHEMLEKEYDKKKLEQSPARDFSKAADGLTETREE